MHLQIKSQFTFNSIILVSSPRKDEDGIPRRIAEELSTLSCSSNNFFFDHKDIVNKDALRKVLYDIEGKCQRGLRPILHLDMHGDRSNGLEIGRNGEMVSWKEIIEWLRPINIRLKNNLVLIITACHGLYVIEPISIREPTPLFCLIAPQEEIKFHEIDDAIGPFYRELIETRSLDKAFEKLSGSFRYFHSEKMLIISMAKYVRRYCMGHGAKERLEVLLTEALKSKQQNTKQNRKYFRKMAKAFIKPKQDLLDRYAKIFLHGATSSFTMADIQRELYNNGETTG